MYQVSNLADYAIDYEVTKGSADWVTLSGELAGTLDPGDTADVSVEINDNAAALPEGTYSETVFFTNLTDHHGDTQRFGIHSAQVIPSKGL